MGALLTRKQAAEVLGISLVTLDKARTDGRLAYIQVKAGGAVRISEDAIAAYLARATHEARPEVKMATKSTFRRRRA